MGSAGSIPGCGHQDIIHGNFVRNEGKNQLKSFKAFSLNQTVFWKDLYWQRKTRLFQKYTPKFIEKLDSIAEEFSGDADTDAIELVDCITKECEDDDALKARSLAVWIASHVVYDDQLDVQECAKPEYVLLHRRSICSGFCRLYEYLSGLVGIQCKYVSGLGRGSDYDPTTSFRIDPETTKIHDTEPHEHAWNMVKLHGQWYTLDLTWAAGFLQHSEETLQFFSQWQEEWFLCEPQTFLSTHFPFKNRFPYPKRQNLSQGSFTNYVTQTGPQSDVLHWADTPLITPIFTAFGLKIQSHKTLWVDASKENYFKLTFETTIQLSIDFAARISKEGVAVKNRTMISSANGKVCVRGFLCEPGDYKFELWGSLVKSEDCLNAKKLLCVYGIRSESSEETLPLPGPAIPYWGPTYLEEVLGITALSHRDPTIDVTSPSLDMVFSTELKDDRRTVEFRANLFCGESIDGEPDDVNLVMDEEACTWWRAEGKTRLRVVVKSTERYYRLTIYGKEPRSEDWLTAANYLLIT